MGAIGSCLRKPNDCFHLQIIIDNDHQGFMSFVVNHDNVEAMNFFRRNITKVDSYGVIDRISMDEIAEKGYHSRVIYSRKRIKKPVYSFHDTYGDLTMIIHDHYDDQFNPNNRMTTRYGITLGNDKSDCKSYLNSSCLVLARMERNYENIRLLKLLENIAVNKDPYYQSTIDEPVVRIIFWF